MDKQKELSAEDIRVIGAIADTYLLILLQEAKRSIPPVKKKDPRYYEELRQKYGHKKRS